MTEGARVLVADDDAAIRRLLTTVLKRAGYRVDAVSDGGEAIAKLEACPYDVMLLDLMMPVANGFDVLRRIRAREPQRRFVVITSAASPDMIARSAGRNVYAALRKPFELTELLATVKAIAFNARPSGATGSESSAP